jgi:hypothetical protein
MGNFEGNNIFKVIPKYMIIWILIFLYTIVAWQLWHKLYIICRNVENFKKKNCFKEKKNCEGKYRFFFSLPLVQERCYTLSLNFMGFLICDLHGFAQNSVVHVLILHSVSKLFLYVLAASGEI